MHYSIIHKITPIHSPLYNSSCLLLAIIANTLQCLDTRTHICDYFFYSDLIIWYLSPLQRTFNLNIIVKIIRSGHSFLRLIPQEQLILFQYSRLFRYSLRQSLIMNCLLLDLIPWSRTNIIMSYCTYKIYHRRKTNWD